MACFDQELLHQKIHTCDATAAPTQTTSLHEAMKSGCGKPPGCPRCWSFSRRLRQARVREPQDFGEAGPDQCRVGVYGQANLRTMASTVSMSSGIRDVMTLSFVRKV